MAYHREREAPRLHRLDEDTPARRRRLAGTIPYYEFREVLNGDIEPKWTEVWAHINLGKIFDITGQRERAVNEYNLAVRTRDDTQGAQEEAAKYLKEPYKRQRTAAE